MPPKGDRQSLVLNAPESVWDKPMVVTEQVAVMPACVMVKGWVPIEMVPVRELDDELAATVYATVPLPDPLAPLVMVIHEDTVVAVHATPAPAVTVTLPELCAAENEALDGVIVRPAPLARQFAVIVRVLFKVKWLSAEVLAAESTPVADPL